MKWSLICKRFWFASYIQCLSTHALSFHLIVSILKRKLHIFQQIFTACEIRIRFALELILIGTNGIMNTKTQKSLFFIISQSMLPNPLVFKSLPDNWSITFHFDFYTVILSMWDINLVSQLKWPLNHLLDGQTVFELKKNVKRKRKKSL